MDYKKRVGIVLTADGLPVPAVKGGAVEQLLTMLMESNEDHGDLFMTYYIPIACKHDVESLGLNKDYKHAKFNYIAVPKFKKFFVKAFNKVFRMVFKKGLFTDPYYQKAYKMLKRDKNDFILFEGQYPLNINRYIKTFGRDNLGFHIHCQFIADKYGADKYTQKFVSSPKTGIQNFGKVLCVSKFIRDDWAQIYDRLGYNNKENLYYYPNSIDESKFDKEFSNEEKQALRSSLGYTDEDFVCIICGRISEVKGVRELIHSVVNTNEKHIKLLIMGSVNFDTNTNSPYLEEVKALCKAHQDQVTFTGYVKNTEVYKYLKASQVQAIPSLWNDAAPLTALEGRWSSVPVLATRTGGLTEHCASEGCMLVSKGETIEAELTEALLKLYNDKDLLKHMQATAKVGMERHSKEMFYQNFVRIMCGGRVDE